MIISTEYVVTIDYLYHYWNSTGDRFDFNNNSQVILSNNANNGSHLLASSQTYTTMTYGLLLPLFFMFCLIYCLLLTLLQYFMSPDFRSSTHGERVKIVLKLFIIPEANGDCQSREWKLEMLLLGLMQVVSNLIFLVPIFVAGKIFLIFLSLIDFDFELFYKPLVDM